jgi:hypothetical protein
MRQRTPWFDRDYSKFITPRKHKLQWLQDLIQIDADDLKNVRHVRNKNRESEKAA